MRKGLFAELPPFSQLIFVVFTMLVCFMMFMFIGIAIAAPIFGVPVSSLSEALSSESANLDLLRFIQVLQGVSLFIIPALFLGYLFSGSPVNYFGFQNKPRSSDYLIIFLIMLAAVPFINLLVSLNEMITFPKSLSWLEDQLRASENTAQDITKLFLKVDGVGGLFFNLFMIALLPALGEELIFRGVIQKILIRWTGNIHAGIIVAAFLFSVMHMQFYGLFPRWLLGAMFGYMLIWSGSIWLPVFAHFVNNAMAVITAYLTDINVIPEEVADYGATWGAIPVTIITTIICIWLLWKIRKRQ